MPTGKKKTTTERKPAGADEAKPAKRKTSASKKRPSAKGDATISLEPGGEGAADAIIPSESDYGYFEHVKLTIDKNKYFERPISTKEELAEIRGKMEEDVKAVKDIMGRLEGYLRTRVDTISINAKQFEILIPIEYMSLKFTTILSVHPQWVFIKCKVMDFEDVPDKIRHQLYERILVSNFELNAVFFSVDPDLTAIWVENDIAVPGLDLNTFEVEFNAIIFGIRYFVDSIALPLNQQMKSTFDATSLYT
ncbi:MAG: type III secretion system chaperone [Candidatus Lokiarchaeota archaeon]|nr:type III secretion system chaperone [Candidatus Lokiarchaeota archaeon]